MSGCTMEAAALFGFASCDDLSGRVRCGKISSFQSGQLICWYLLSIHSCTNLSSVLIRGLDGYGWIAMKTDCACQLDLSGCMLSKFLLMFWDSWDKIIRCFSPRTDSEFMDVTLILPTWTCEKECATFPYPFHRILHLGCAAKLQFWWVTWSFLFFLVFCIMRCYGSLRGLWPSFKPPKVDSWLTLVVPRGQPDLVVHPV